MLWIRHLCCASGVHSSATKLSSDLWVLLVFRGSIFMPSSTHVEAQFLWLSPFAMLAHCLQVLELLLLLCCLVLRSASVRKDSPGVCNRFLPAGPAAELWSGHGSLSRGAPTRRRGLGQPYGLLASGTMVPCYRAWAALWLPADRLKGPWAIWRTKWIVVLGIQIRLCFFNPLSSKLPTL